MARRIYQKLINSEISGRRGGFRENLKFEKDKSSAVLENRAAVARIIF